MAEYIERQKAIDLFSPVDPENDGSDGTTLVCLSLNYSSADIESKLSDMPAEDVAPVRHGRWEFLGPNRLAGDCMCGTCSFLQSQMQVYCQSIYLPFLRHEDGFGGARE